MVEEKVDIVIDTIGIGMLIVGNLYEAMALELEGCELQGEESMIIGLVKRSKEMGLHEFLKEQLK